MNKAGGMSARLRRLAIAMVVVALVAGTQGLQAGSATWNLNPTSNDWNTAENWTPATIPSSETDVATFGVSNTTNVVCGDAPGPAGTTTVVGGIVFTEGASSYTITVTPVFDIVYPSVLDIYGAGITNDSGVVQNLVAANSGTTKASARIAFEGSSSAGDNVVITNEGGASATGDGRYGAFTEFGYQSSDTASAGDATVITNGGEVSGAIGGFALLTTMSNANRATFINYPGEVSGAGSGSTLIETAGNIGSSTFIGNPATITGAEGGWAEYDYGTANGARFIANGATTAGPEAGQIYVYGGDGYATFRGKGGRASGAQGGLIDLFNLPNSDQTVVIAESGRNGGLGGTILIENEAVVDQGQFQLHGNGTLDLTNATTQIVSIGSLTGNGIVSLAGHALSIGNNNLNTGFSGLIQGSGGVTKVGSGTLTLTGANTYTAATTVTAGTLRVNNQTGSATGTGVVRVTAGTLGGKGIIAGLVTIGTGSGTGAVLAPSVGSNRPVILTIQRALTFKADSTYSYKLTTRNPNADQVIASGVTIDSAAQFSFQQIGNNSLSGGTVFTAISNTSVNPIAGTFANLPDGSTFTVGNNTFQVSYEGGDGNDLTLTVVP
jgi:autotransporter-associated beta strand protein